jgi:uncharacterized protein YndB with AHSA1/START domain
MTRAIRPRKPAFSSPAAVAQDAAPAPAHNAAGFGVSARKTIAASPARTFAAWTETRRRAHWLIGVKLTIRERKAPKFVRLTCDDDGTDIGVTITAKGRDHCVVAVKHTRLASAQLVIERRHCWREMLRHLKHYLEGQA